MQATQSSHATPTNYYPCLPQSIANRLPKPPTFITALGEKIHSVLTRLLTWLRSLCPSPRAPSGNEAAPQTTGVPARTTPTPPQTQPAPMAATGARRGGATNPTAPAPPTTSTAQPTILRGRAIPTPSAPAAPLTATGPIDITPPEEVPAPPTVLLTQTAAFLQLGISDAAETIVTLEIRPQPPVDPTTTAAPLTAILPPQDTVVANPPAATPAAEPTGIIDAPAVIIDAPAPAPAPAPAATHTENTVLIPNIAVQDPQNPILPPVSSETDPGTLAVISTLMMLAVSGIAPNPTAAAASEEAPTGIPLPAAVAAPATLVVEEEAVPAPTTRRAQTPPPSQSQRTLHTAAIRGGAVSV